MLYSPNIKKAVNIAFKAHNGQYDKGGYPYIMHPLHLAEEMETEDEVITSLLHDVLWYGSGPYTNPGECQGNSALLQESHR